MVDSSMRVASVPLFNLRQVDESCAYIVEKIGVAARAGADVVVFPETATNAYQHGEPEADRAGIERWMPEILQAVREAAGPWMVLGSYTFGEGVCNSALVVDPAGEVRANYHKIAEGGRRWLMLEINGVYCTVVICSDFWVPGILLVPKMLGAQVCFYPHASGGVQQERDDWSALYYVRAWESRMFLVMADCSWEEGGTFARPDQVPYPYDFDHHLHNQSCIIDPQPRYLARHPRDAQDGLLIADIDPARVREPMDPKRYTIGQGWEEMLDCFRRDGSVEWMK